MRGGKVIGNIDTARTNAQELADWMVGRRVIYGLTPSAARPSKAAALELEELCLRDSHGRRTALSEISLTVQGGEIVGIAGVEGNGQTELLEAVLHPREPRCRSAGTVKGLGQDVTHWTTDRIRALGLALIPSDRLRDGILPERPLLENWLLGRHRLPRFNRKGYLDLAACRTIVAQSLTEYDVRPADLALAAGHLSGGNQQKLVLARELQDAPKLVLAAQPTRGVDVGAIEFIHRQLLHARDRGAGILLISSDLDEILSLSDRILVLYEGRIAAQFQRGQVTERELGMKLGGA
jgi:general nucleoside transport system ATP-binding protein